MSRPATSESFGAITRFHLEDPQTYPPIHSPALPAADAHPASPVSHPSPNDFSTFFSACQPPARPPLAGGPRFHLRS